MYRYRFIWFKVKTFSAVQSTSISAADEPSVCRCLDVPPIQLRNNNSHYHRVQIRIADLCEKMQLASKTYAEQLVDVRMSQRKIGSRVIEQQTLMM